jgi:hypothetical protein
MKIVTWKSCVSVCKNVFFLYGIRITHDGDEYLNLNFFVSESIRPVRTESKYIIFSDIKFLYTADKLPNF